MNTNYFNYFSRKESLHSPDFGEKIGCFGLGLLRISFGKTFIVKPISDQEGALYFERKFYSTSQKIAALSLFTLALPVTLVFATIGLIGAKYSQSQKKMEELHRLTLNIQKVAPPIPAVKEIIFKPIEDLHDDLQVQAYESLRSVEFLIEKDLPYPFNRFRNIWSPKQTALCISGRYLHANEVGANLTDRRFIASQAPLETDYETFWKGVLEKNPVIFDLTTLEDLTKGVTKYYPESPLETIKYGSICVTLLEHKEGMSTYQITDDLTGASREISRFHFLEWKDFNAVDLPTLQHLIEKFESLVPDPKNMAWIHCRAGVGRTGTLITAVILKEKIISGEIKKDNLDTKLIDLIIELRKQRGHQLVQTKQQLDLLRKYALSLL